MNNDVLPGKNHDFPSIADDKERFLTHLSGLSVGAEIDIAFEPLSDDARRKIEDFYNQPTYTPDQVERQ